MPLRRLEAQGQVRVRALSEAKRAEASKPRTNIDRAGARQAVPFVVRPQEPSEETATMKIRNRIKELRWVPARELLVNPKNWRSHPPAQREALN